MKKQTSTKLHAYPRRAIPWLPTIIALAALLFLTLQSPQGTTELSKTIQRWLKIYFSQNGGVPPWVRNMHTVRSLAHTPEYFILGCALFIGFYFTLNGNAKDGKEKYGKAKSGTEEQCAEEAITTESGAIKNRSVLRPALYCLVTGTAIGLLDEGLKELLPTREFDLGDWGLDVIGITTAVLICTLITVSVRTIRRRRSSTS